MDGRTLIGEVSEILRDPRQRQWSLSRLTTALNEAFATLCTLKPDAYTVLEDIPLVGGKTEQVIPADAHAIVDVLHNVINGQRSRVVSLVDQAALDAVVVDWHTHPSLGYVKHWMKDEMNDRILHVYPQADTSQSTSIRAKLAKVPCIVDGALPVDCSSIVIPPEPVAPIPPVSPGELGDGGNVAAGGVRFANDHNPDNGNPNDWSPLEIDAEMETGVEHDIVFNVTASAGNGSRGFGTNPNAVRVRHIPNDSPTTQTPAIMGLHDRIAAGITYSGAPFTFLLQEGDPRIEAGMSIRVVADNGRYALGGFDVVGFGEYSPGVTQADIDAYQVALNEYNAALVQYGADLAAYRAALNEFAACMGCDPEVFVPDFPEEPAEITPESQAAFDQAVENYYNIVYAKWIRDASCDGTLPDAPVAPGPAPVSQEDIDAHAASVARFMADQAAFDAAVAAANTAGENSTEEIPAGSLTIDSDIPVDKIYYPFLREWMLYRSYCVDDEMTPNYGRAAQHFQRSFNLLGLRVQGKLAIQQVRETIE